MAFQVDGVIIPVHKRIGNELINRVQEAPDIADGLESQQVGGAQRLADAPCDVVRNHVPILRRGPGDVDEVLYHSVGHALADEFGHQVQVVIVADDDRRLLQGPGLFDHRIGECLVHWDITRFPGVVHGGIDVGVVGRVPHVVLQEPEERVAQDIVILVVDPPGSYHVTQIDLVAGERGSQVGGLAVAGNDPVSFAHGAGHPGELEFLGH